MRFLFSLVFLSCLFSSFTAQAISICETSAAACLHETNKRRIGLISGSARGTYIKIADDIRNVLDGYATSDFKDGEGLRVTPIVGLGSVKNIEDLLYLRATDVGLVQADVLLHFKNAAKQTPGRYSEILDKIKYLAAVYNEEVHLVCRRGGCGKTLGEKTDLMMNIGPRGSGTALTAQLILEALGFSPSKFTTLSYVDALKQLKLKKEDARVKIDGMFWVGGKPLELLQTIKESDGLELVEITEIPYDLSIYQPGLFTEDDDYTGLLGNRATLQTISVQAVLAVYGGNYRAKTRYQNLVALCQGLIEKHRLLKNKAKTGAAHPKWISWNPKDKVKFWNRHPCMTKALKSY